jgi:flagellar biogenesis protein FliO
MPLSRFRSALAEPRPIHRAFLFAGGLLLLFLVVQLVPSAGGDAPPSPGAASEAEASGSPRGGYDLFSVGNLLALGLLAGGGAYALHLRKRTGGGGGPALFEPVGQMQLGQGQGLRLVRCGGEILLLGVTSGQITLLSTYPDDAFDDAFDGSLSRSPAAHATPAAGFADLLRTHVVGSHA